jgi:hypothetical protein
MPFSLDNIRATVQKRGWNIVVYGVPGAGKSTLAVDACKEFNGVFILGEDGISTLAGAENIPNTGLISSWWHFKSALDFFANDNHPFKLIVIDTLDAIVPHLQTMVIQSHFDNSADKANAYGAKYPIMYKYFNEMIESMKLAQSKGINIIQLVHGTVERVKDPNSEEYSRHNLTISNERAVKIQDMLVGYADIVGFAHFEAIVKDGKAKGGRRVLATQSNPSYVAKTRYKMPDIINLEWSEISQYLK